MKLITKLFSALFVLFLLTAFTACSGANSSTPEEPAAETTTDSTTTQNNETQDIIWVTEEMYMGGGTWVRMKLTFKPDGTYDYRYLFREDPDWICATGTYTGNPAEDGEITVTTTKFLTSWKNPVLADQDPPEVSTYTISNGILTAAGAEFSRE